MKKVCDNDSTDNWFRNNIGWEVGNGMKIIFWHEKCGVMERYWQRGLEDYTITHKENRIIWGLWANGLKGSGCENCHGQENGFSGSSSC